MLPTVGSDVSCAGRKVESLEKNLFSRLHLLKASTPLIAKSVHSLKIISDCLTYPGPQCEIVIVAKIVF